MKQLCFSLVRFSLLSLLIVVVGCSSNRKPDYLKSESLPPVKVPENLDDRRLGQLYQLPKQEIIVPNSFKVPFPPATSSVQGTERRASLQKLEDKLWLLNNRSVSKTWVQLVEFWRNKDIALAKIDLENALIETGWFNESIQPGFSIRYRLRLERGFQDNTTEVYVSNEKRDNGNLIREWYEQSKSVGDDAVHAQLIAEALLTQLLNSRTDVGDSLLAESISLPEKSNLTLVGNEPVLLLDSGAGNSRVYKALSNALVSEGFLLYDTDLANGFFHFDQYEIDQKKRRVFGLVRTNQRVEKEKIIASKKSRHSLKKIITRLPNKPTVNSLFFDGKNRPKESRLSGVPGFLIAVKSQDKKHLIYIRDGYGKKLKSDDAKALLDEVRLRLL